MPSSTGSLTRQRRHALGVYTLHAVAGSALRFLLQTVVSVAIWNHFRKNGGGDVFSTDIAPWLSFVVQIYLVDLPVTNLATCAGTSGFANAIPALGTALMVFGLIWGFLLKIINPEGDKTIGHVVNDKAWGGCPASRHLTETGAARNHCRFFPTGSPKMAHSITGRVIVVTGGAKSIGLGIAQVFAAAGAKVAIHAAPRMRCQSWPSASGTAPLSRPPMSPTSPV